MSKDDKKLVSLKPNLHKRIDSLIDVEKVAEDLAYSIKDDDALREHSYLMFFYGELSARAEHQASYFKAELDRVEAQMDKDLRSVFAAKGEKFTESRLEKEIKSNPEYNDLQSAYRDAKYIQNLVSSIVNAFEHRRSTMLVEFKNHFSASTQRTNF